MTGEHVIIVRVDIGSLPGGIKVDIGDLSPGVAAFLLEHAAAVLEMHGDPVVTVVHNDIEMVSYVSSGEWDDDDDD